MPGAGAGAHPLKPDQRFTICNLIFIILILKYLKDIKSSHNLFQNLRMSEVFANYEEEYNKLSSQINKKINNIFNQTNGFFYIL